MNNMSILIYLTRQVDDIFILDKLVKNSFILYANTAAY